METPQAQPARPEERQISRQASGAIADLLGCGPPLLIELEREVQEEHRELMRDRLVKKIEDVQSSLRGSAPRCCDQAMENRGQSSRTVLGLLGKLQVRASRYRCKSCHGQRFPLLEKLGVEPGQLSGSLARFLALLGVLVPYEMAARLASLFFGVNVNAMTVWRSVQRLGEAVIRQEESRIQADLDGPMIESEQAPDVIEIGLDGCALGMQVRSTRRTREAPGQPLPALPAVEDGHFREVKTGALFQPAHRVQSSPGRRTLWRRVLVTCLGSADEIYDRVWSKIQELGWLGKNTTVVVIGDGAEWIWNRASIFPRRCEILDFWHAIEHAWKLARLRFGTDSKVARRWVARVAKDLRAGRVEVVLKRLRRMKTKTAEEQEELTALIRYYTTHKDRMRYKEYLRLGYGIGSGAVESAHKQVVHARMRQAGMRWSEPGARRLLALRLLLLNDNWALLDRVRQVPIPA